MPSLRYRAVTRAGAREVGTIDAATTDAATAALRQRGLIVLDVALAAGRKFSYDSAVEVELGAVRTVRDLARWVQSLPQSDADASIHTSTTPDA